MPTNLSLTTRDVARELARRYSTMTHDELDILESILVPMKFSKGEKILDEGQVCRHIFWIVKGLVRQFYYKNNKELTEYMATENTICMSIESLFKETPSMQIIQALEPTIIFAIPMHELEMAAMKSVNIQMLYRKILEESLIISQQHADMLRFESAQDRYQKLVKTAPQLVLRAPLVYIASYLQMTPETLSRVRTATLLNG
ncbi:Crp/Fnr family transcriptional regulator [Prevotella sp. E13-17]|uniref:Crp/Fnr family transcriptional regulator n=1 Tax=Prevotella sp. E13-17 TaxID=2913616 RepID=UPI001EDBBE0D|nr:Crp/Fnr family transcriptional regulator [Prevotella sp. E13-17]UKK51942.1 Crp/Fnr family transcriptional regulator [Prevotella sp. E13-17]